MKGARRRRCKGIRGCVGVGMRSMCGLAEYCEEEAWYQPTLPAVSGHQLAAHSHDIRRMHIHTWADIAASPPSSSFDDYIRHGG